MMMNASRSFITTLQRNIDGLIYQSLLFPHHSSLISQKQFEMSNMISNVNDIIKTVLRNDPTISMGTLRFKPDFLFDDLGTSKSWKEVSLENDVMDYFYLTISVKEGAGVNGIYSTHNESKMWWKRLINCPLNLSQKIQPRNCEIIYHPCIPGNKEEDSGYLIEKTWIEDIDLNGKEIPILCNMKSVKTCLNTVLFDSKCSIGSYQFLKIHHSIVPIQTSILISSENETGSFVDDIIHGLLRENISFEIIHSEKLPEAFKLNDSLAVPFTLLITDDTVSSGIVGIRDRNNHLIEPVNFKNVMKYLRLNLKIRSL